MQFISFYASIAVAFVLLCCCHGMPPKQSLTGSRFTEQEHELLIHMLDSFAKKSSYNPCIWKEIETAFEEKRGKVHGFSTYRTSKSLQRHLLHALKVDKFNIPETVRDLHEQMKRTGFTPQEQAFITQQLLGSEDDGLSLLGDRRWRNIQIRHEAKRKAGEFGFSNKRSFGVLRIHFQAVMIPKNLVHEDIKRKFAGYFNDKKCPTSVVCGSSSSENVVTQFPHYTNQEHELMFKILKSQAETGEYQSIVWNDILKAFEEKRNANADGFALRRSFKSLHQHFLSTLRSGKIPESDPLWKLYEQMKRIAITRQEQNLINRELARTDMLDWSLTSTERWKKILQKLEEEREAGTPGFTNRRTWDTLRNHFVKVMKPKNLVDKAVKEKYPRDFANNESALTAEASGRYAISSGESMEFSSNEEADYAEWVDEYGVDDFMLLD